MILQGHIVDVLNRKIFKGEITISAGKIMAIKAKDCAANHYIIPGFIDAHIHIESAMLVPSEFAKIAVTHGTVATVSDPHEIANVLGVKGVDFMIENGKQTPFKFNFGAPSCVPATRFESAGATIDSEAIKALMANPDIKYLAEMMNYPGVLRDDPEVLKKIHWATHYGKPIDGHAPGLIGHDITKYIAAGIATDHECFTYEEAFEKLQKGMKILIREGSAAKNFEALVGLLPAHFENMMFCSDDKHPDDLISGHINTLCARAVAKGVDVFKVLQAACVNPVQHYNLDVGLLRVGDAADCVIVNNLKAFKVLQTYINGQLVSDQGQAKFPSVACEILNNFNAVKKTIAAFKVPSKSSTSKASTIRVIEALDGQLVTKAGVAEATIKAGNVISNTDKDLLKIAVVNRYNNDAPALAFIKNFGLQYGAIASSVAHDSHNIIAVGASDAMLCKAVNLIIKHKGGICAVSASHNTVIPLPVAGIMSTLDAETMAKQYAALNARAKQMGCSLKAPFMTLSFMALLVIPTLKLSDRGLFDAHAFQFTSVHAED